MTIAAADVENGAAPLGEMLENPVLEDARDFALRQQSGDRVELGAKLRGLQCRRHRVYGQSCFVVPSGYIAVALVAVICRTAPWL